LAGDGREGKRGFIPGSCGLRGRGAHVRKAVMRVRLLAVGAALSLAAWLAACSSQSNPDSPSGSGGKSGTGGARGGSTGSGPDGSSGSSGSSNAGGASGGSSGAASGGASGASSGGENGGSGGSGGAISGSGGAGPADAALETAAPADTGGTSNGGSSGDGGGNAGGTALMVVGPQIIGTDKDIIAQLEAHHLKVVTVVDTMATPADTMGKALVVLSYSLDSDNFKADFSTVTAPIILMERGLLARLGMTSSDKWAEPVTALTIVAGDSPLAAGLPAGDQVVYSKPGEFFWGMPSAEAIKVATVKGNPNQWVLFAYPAGAMMVGKKAAGKRLHFFFGSHLVPDTYLNDTGKKLLGAAIDWSVK
jgi:hypothetical protein